MQLKYAIVYACHLNPLFLVALLDGFIQLYNSSWAIRYIFLARFAADFFSCLSSVVAFFYCSVRAESLLGVLLFPIGCVHSAKSRYIFRFTIKRYDLMLCVLLIIGLRFLARLRPDLLLSLMLHK